MKINLLVLLLGSFLTANPSFAEEIKVTYRADVVNLDTFECSAIDGSSFLNRASIRSELPLPAIIVVQRYAAELMHLRCKCRRFVASPTSPARGKSNRQKRKP